MREKLRGEGKWRGEQEDRKRRRGGRGTPEGWSVQKNKKKRRCKSVEAGKKKIWNSGKCIEVTDEVYTAYMKGNRKIRYFENDLKTERTVKDKDGNIKQIFPSREDSLDRLMEDNAQQFSDSHESVEDIVIQKISLEKLHMALSKLSKKDRELIYALFYEEKTERDYAKQIGVYPSAVHSRKIRVLKKLKNLLK